MTGPPAADLAACTRDHAGSAAVADKTATSDEHPLIEVEKLVVSFGSVFVLNGVDLSVFRQSSLGILGPSGSGKTTLLNALAGFVSVRSGFIRTNAAPELRRPLKTMVFQDHGLFPYMTVFKNIAFGLESHGKSKTEIVERVLYLSGLFEIESLLNENASALSGGEKQRVGLARALAPCPQILLLDEPFSQLDLPLRELVRQRVLQLIRHERITVVLVSHDYTDIFTLAETVAVLDRGQIVQQDRPCAMYAEPRTIAAAKLTGRLVSLAARVESNRLVFGDGENVQTVPCQHLLSHSAITSDGVAVAYRPECAAVTHRPMTDPNCLVFSGRLIAAAQRTYNLECLVEIPSLNEILIGISANDRNPLKIDDDVYIAVPLNRLLVFNKSTGERII